MTKTVSLVKSGYHLNFCFVCGYGSASTFGKDKNIFHWDYAIKSNSIFSGCRLSKRRKRAPLFRS